MKLIVSQKKDKDGEIEVKIMVLNRGDYVTTDIFNTNECIAQNGKFLLCEAETAEITELFSTAEAARAHSAEFIEKIRTELDNWRKIEIDDEYAIEI